MRASNYSQRKSFLLRKSKIACIFRGRLYRNYFRPSSHQSKKEKLIYKKEDLNLSDDIFEEKINVTLPTSAMNNGTFWSRVILYPTGKRQLATQAFGRMISYQVPIRYANLLGDENAKDIGKLQSKIAAFYTL